MICNVVFLLFLNKKEDQNRLNRGVSNGPLRHPPKIPSLPTGARRLIHYNYLMLAPPEKGGERRREKRGGN